MEVQYSTRRNTSLIARRIRFVYWIVVPLVCLAVMEFGARQLAKRAWVWYPSASQLAQRDAPLDALFIGNSRVGAAIDADAFDEQVSALTGKAHSSINVGMGFTTLVEHYLALRNLKQDYPDVFKGTTVFIAAPDSIPNYDGISECWYYDQTPHFLLMHMKASDIPQFLRSNCTYTEKVDLLRLYLFKGSATLVYREWLNRQFWKKIENQADTFTASKTSETQIDLDTSGGVRADSAGVAMVYNAQMAQLDTVSTKQVPAYEATLLAAIKEMVHTGGGRVVLYELPISTISRKILSKEVSQEDRSRFTSALNHAGYTWVFAPEFEYSDEDFPDASHLRASRKAEFSEMLADSWVEREND